MLQHVLGVLYGHAVKQCIYLCGVLVCVVDLETSFVLPPDPFAFFYVRSSLLLVRSYVEA